MFVSIESSDNATVTVSMYTMSGFLPRVCHWTSVLQIRPLLQFMGSNYISQNTKSNEMELLTY